MKKIIFILSLVFFNIGFYAQSDYYWSKGKTFEINEDVKKKFIIVDSTISNPNLLTNLLQKEGLVVVNFYDMKISNHINVKDSTFLSNKEYGAIVESRNPINTNVFNNYSKILYHSRVHDGNIAVSDLIYVKLKNANDTLLLDSICNQNNIHIIGNLSKFPLWYILKTDNLSNGDALAMANMIYETGLVESSQPRFLNNIKLHSTPPVPTFSNINDPLFCYQWNLNNVNDYENIDINIGDAWEITKGDTSITVAIIDNGPNLNHPDFPNISFSLDAKTEHPSVTYDCSYSHGTNCLGIIGAQHNNIGIAGIAPNCNILPISINFHYSNTNLDFDLANAFELAEYYNADVISNSWGGSNHPDLIIEAINNAQTYGRGNKGCVVVFSAGNGGNSHALEFPASLDIVISVGAIDSCGIRCEGHPGFDEHTLMCGSIWGADYYSSYGEQLNLVAPGNDIRTATQSLEYPNMLYTENFSGTSAACPHVSGVAALMLSVNPNLTWQDVKTILEVKAQKIREDVYTFENFSSHPMGKWNNKLGYGLVDAGRSVSMAQYAFSQGVDLYIKDRPEDVGVPGGYDWQAPRDQSPDIWIRNQNDGLSEHQEPIYSPNTPVYVYVRVRNKGSLPSTGNEKIALYWSKASTWASWPGNWDGSNPSIGNQIGTAKSVGTILPGRDKVFVFEWYINDPTIDGKWHQCLLARVENSKPIIIHPGRLDDDVYFNNHVAWKNCFVVGQTPCCGLVHIGNPENFSQTMTLKFLDTEKSTKFNILNFVDVHLKFDSISWTSVSNIFQNNRGVNILRPGHVQIIDNNLALNNINWSANTLVPANIQFYLKSKVKHKKNEYKYEIREYLLDSVGTEVGFGGLYFTIDVPNINTFEANTKSNVKTNHGKPVELYAVQQDVPNLEYNWYDEDGILIGSGTNIFVNPDSTTLYTLEVSHSNFCMKDVANVVVEVNYNFISNIIPNPTSSNLTIEYQFDQNITSGQIKIYNQAGVLMSTHNLNINSNSINLNVARYRPGTYTVVLIGNNIEYDNANFVKF